MIKKNFLFEIALLILFGVACWAVMPSFSWEVKKNENFSEHYSKENTGSNMISDREKSIIDLVARERGLTQEEAILLYAIRSHEDGDPGLEMGVVQPCARYYGDGFISLIVQADYSAWLIRERYLGSIDKFSKVYHHGNKETDERWSDGIKTYYRIYFKKYAKNK